jgi:polysaccharide export outer membrane protein
MTRILSLVGAILLLPSVADAQGEFRLGSGDQIQIDIIGEPDLIRTQTILPDGTITFPYLKAFQAEGMTPQELDDHLTAALTEYLIHPEVTVTVQNLTSKRVYVFGEVNQEGPMVLTARTRLIEALALAGSFNKERANLREVLVLREQEGERKVRTADLRKFLQLGGTEGDLVLSPGDIVYVPTKMDRVYVFGEVIDPGVYPFEDRMTILAAVGMARGFLDSAARRSVLVVRNAHAPNPEHFRLDLWKAAKDGDHSDNILLQTNDIVIVPKKFISEVALFIRQWFVDVGSESMSFYEQAWNLQNLKYRTEILKDEAKNPTDRPIWYP